MSAKRIVLVVGARPNFMKSAPLMRELGKYPSRFEKILIHTGQHYDHKLSQLFFEELNALAPYYCLFLYPGGGDPVSKRPDVTLVIGRPSL